MFWLYLISTGFGSLGRGDLMLVVGKWMLCSPPVGVSIFYLSCFLSPTRCCVVFYKFCKLFELLKLGAILFVTCEFLFWSEVFFISSSSSSLNFLTILSRSSLLSFLLISYCWFCWAIACTDALSWSFFYFPCFYCYLCCGFKSCSAFFFKESCPSAYPFYLISCFLLTLSIAAFFYASLWTYCFSISIELSVFLCDLIPSSIFSLYSCLSLCYSIFILCYNWSYGYSPI